jgi:hypothetical protein
VRITQKLVYTLGLRPVRITEGETEIAVTFLRLVLQKDHPTRGKIDYDSRRDTEPANQAVWVQSVQVGKTVRVTLDRKGKVLKVEGYKEIGKVLLAKLEKKNPFLVSMLKDTLLTSYKNELWAQRMTQYFTTLPPGPARPGHAWEEKITYAMDASGTVELDRRRTLEAVEGDEAKIKIAGTLRVRNPMLKLRSSRVEGSCRFDLGAGRLLEQTVKTTYRAEVFETEMTVTETVETKFLGVKKKEEGKKAGKD